MTEELIEISRIVGMRNDYVQAGGGNTSVKMDNECMAIKSSGYLLSDMKQDNGYTIVNYPLINKMIVDGCTNENEILKMSHISGKKASIEVFLHAITKKYTVHIHSLLSNIVLVRDDSREIINKLFPDALYVDYTTPGLELAINMLKEYKKEEIIFLENHGLIVTADTYDKVFELIEKIDSRLSEYLGIRFNKFDNVTKLYNLLKKYSDDLIFLSEDKDIYMAFEKNGKKLWNYKFCPDCVVYCGLKELNLKSIDENQIDKFLKANGKIVLIVYENNIYICANTLKKAREIESLLSFSAKIYLNNIDRNMNYLTDSEAKKLYNCDFEKYRQNIN